MKKLLFVLVLFFIGFCTDTLCYAQTPEFSLHMFLKIENKTRDITFGYDPSASDGLDKQFNEADYPSSPGDDWDLLNNDSSYHGDGGVGHLKVDIRHKPTDASFRMVFRWNLNMGYPTTVSWDRAAIPSIIKAILVSPTANPKQVLVDLTKQSSFVIDANSALYYTDDSIAVYYNEVPSSVGPERAPGDLLSELSGSPNPSLGTARITMRLSKTAEVAIHAYDIAGRLLMVKTFKGEVGLNEQPIAIAGYHGPIYVRVDAAADFTRASQNLTLIAE